MWDCPKCSERIEDTFEVCWNCGTSNDGHEDPDFRPEGTPEDRAGPRERTESTGKSRPRTWLLAGAVYGFVLAFTPRPAGFEENPTEEVFGHLEEIFRTLPLWVSACLLVLLVLWFGAVVLMGSFIRRFMVRGAPVKLFKSGPSWFKTAVNFERRLIVAQRRFKLLKSGPSWFKTMFSFNWPLHWWENVFWAFVGGGVGISISAPFVGMWALCQGGFTLIAVLGVALGFRLEARQLDEADGK